MTGILKKSKLTIVIMSVFVILCMVSTSWAWPIPDTEQQGCYDYGLSVKCPAPGEDYYGYDGNYEINPQSYTKLDASGNDLPDSATSWTMVRDNVTGLIWENKTNDGTIHDVSKTFTWCDKNSSTNGGNQGTCGTGTGDSANDTEAFIKTLNDAKYGGFSDWRLPRPMELATLVNLYRVYSNWSSIKWIFINASPPLNFYWSSDTSAEYNDQAWFVTFSYGGFVERSSKALSYYVRAVRGGKGGGGYVNNGNGTVTDTTKGLMWQQETVSGKTWQEALSYAEGLDLAGYSDWRLPNVTELNSLVEYRRFKPAIDTNVFPGTYQSYNGFSYYWSSSLRAEAYNNQDMYGPNSAWCVDFNSGIVYYNSIYHSTAVRAVRGGQVQSTGSLIISAPTQASLWEIGTQKTILWDSAGIVGNVKITLSRQGGKPGTFTEVITESVPNNGSFIWTVTGPESFNCALRVEPVSDPTKGTTQSLFTIASIQKAWITAEKQRDTSHYKLNLMGQYTDGLRTIDTAFISLDVSIASVDSFGFLTALKNGYVEVSTIYNGTTYKKGLFVYTTLDAGETQNNDTKDTATPMTEGKFYRGKVLSRDVDWFKFTLSSNSFADVGFLSESIMADVKAEFFNGYDTLLASAVSTDGAFFILPVGLSAGTYYMKLSSVGDIDQDNGYIVSYKMIGSLPDKTTTSIQINETKAGTIYTLADRTDFTFTLPQDQAVKILFNPSISTAKYRLSLLNGSQTVIDTVDCLEQPSVSFEAVYAAGDYTLRVTPLDVVDALSPFSVSLTASTNLLEKEPNGISAQATPFDITKSITGRLSSSADIDFYSFSLAAPQYLALTMTIPKSTKNFTVTLYKESDQNEIDGFTVQSGKTATLHMGLGAGRYYLKVSGDGANTDAINPYTLTMAASNQTDLEIESNNTIKFANAIGKDQPKHGRIYSANDIDYYGFHLPEAGFITAHFTPSSTTAGYKVSIVDANGVSMETYTSAGGTAINIVDSYYEAGNYYLKIEPNGAIDQYNPYTLSLTSTANITGIKQLVNMVVTGQKQTLTTGETLTLTAAAGYSDATSESISSPIWSSLNTSVATVNAAGVVTGSGEGTTTIVVAYGGLAGQFDITVGAPAHMVKQHYGNLILLAGGGLADSNILRESTQYLSDLIYRRFKDRLFGDDDIYYFNPRVYHDINGDGFGENIVDDSSPIVVKLGETITQWAASQSTDGPLYVYMIDHGGIDAFMVYPNQILSAVQLKGYLDTFQTQTGRKVVVILEACKSGSFTNDLVTSGQDRVVVTSADNRDSYVDMDGRVSFTQLFVDRLRAGSSVKEAYNYTKGQLLAMGLPYSTMRPQLIESASSLSDQIKVGGNFAIAGLYPEIAAQSPNMSIQANTNQGFYVTLTDLEGIESVWAVVQPPDYIPPSDVADLNAPQVNLPEFPLTDPQGDKKFEGSYNSFTYNGNYLITFYAKNSSGSVTLSMPTVVTVSNGQNLTMRWGDVNGDGVVNLSDVILALQVMSGMTPTGQNIFMSADINGDGKIGLPEVIYILQKVSGIR